MKNKLTNNMLKQMIREVLSEGKKRRNIYLADLPDGVTMDHLRQAHQRLKYSASNELGKNDKGFFITSKNRSFDTTPIVSKATEIFQSEAETPKIDPPEEEPKADPEPKKEPDPPEKELDLKVSDKKIKGYMTPPLEKAIQFSNTNLSVPSDADANYTKLLAALQTALTSAGITKDELSYVAGLFEGQRLNENTTELEIQDIEKLFDIGEVDPTKLHKKYKTGKDEDIFDIGKKVDGMLGQYISQALKLKLPREKVRAFAKAKKEFPKMLARNQGYNPETDFSGIKSYEIPRSAQIDVPSTGKRAKIDPRLIQTFERFFGGTTGFPARIKKLSDFSRKFVNKQDIDLAEFTNGAPILKLMSNITRQFNSTSGGTEIEATLALIASGGKIGGSNGAGDFVDANGKEYSSKWLQASSVVEQSSFKSAIAVNPGKEYSITYVIGVKKTQSGEEATAVTSDLMKTTQISIYAAEYVWTPNLDLTIPNKNSKGARINFYKDGKINSAELISSTKNSGNTATLRDTEEYPTPHEDLVASAGTLRAYAVNADGSRGALLSGDPYHIRINALQKGTNKAFVKGVKDYFFDPGSKWPTGTFGVKNNAKDLVAQIGEPMGTVLFVNAKPSTISDQFEAYIKITSDKAKEYMSNINKKLDAISESTIDFANDKSFTSAFDISDNYLLLKDDMKGLFDSVDETGNTSRSFGLSENKNKKKSKKDLDNLIKEVILKRLLK